MEHPKHKLDKFLKKRKIALDHELISDEFKEGYLILERLGDGPLSNADIQKATKLVDTLISLLEEAFDDISEQFDETEQKEALAKHYDKVLSAVQKEKPNGFHRKYLKAAYLNSLELTHLNADGTVPDFPIEDGQTFKGINKTYTLKEIPFGLIFKGSGYFKII